MELLYSAKPLAAILVSFFVVPIIFSARSENVREAWTFVAALLKFAIVASMLPFVLTGGQIAYTVAEVLPGLAISFKVDAFGMLFALVSSSLWIVTSMYSIGYMRTLKEHGQTRYYACFALSLSATLGVAFAGNLLTLYLFYEMLSFATYPLVSHHQDREARSSGRKYLTYILGASIALVLPAMLIIYSQTGTFEFAPQGFMNGAFSQSTMTVLLLMFVFGFAKAGVMPFHSWLPAAMVAPTPVSALLHAVAVVKVGVFCVARVITGVFGTKMLASMGLGTIVCYIASFTIIVSSIIALSQDGLKRRLAFSTIGQLSYIILGIALLSPSGMTGGMLHIAMHAFGKITLFFCAGAIYAASGIKNISQMVGIGRRMPFTMTAFLLGSLSVIGLPPLGGFISKWNLVIGTLESGQIFFLFVLLASSLLNAAYFLPICYKAFFCTDEEAMFERKVNEVPTWCLVPLCITATCSVIFFFYPQPFLQLAKMTVATIIGAPMP
ncbi:cation:proton antiporter [Desulfoluna limicola]|uniref:Cation:proton antiporter n=1 Tax=Desulfoluna limicola TaxID=2810562 RepID=A0ABM7PLW5_9BACT|nr:monovalent cation/H+ antiporter subunit D family protein [Desulfoluna limicola]BCS98511.1 cation:proton antiporter [Desulfoluna limicola]